MIKQSINKLKNTIGVVSKASFMVSCMSHTHKLARKRHQITGITLARGKSAHGSIMLSHVRKLDWLAFL